MRKNPAGVTRLDDRKWLLSLAAGLIAVSAALYCIHYLIFHDLHHIGVFALHELAFVPFEVLLVTLVIHRMLETREKRKKLEKLNMVIGTFFSVAGNRLLKCFAGCAGDECSGIKNLIINTGWSEKDFDNRIKELSTQSFGIELCNIDLNALKEFLVEKEDFFIRLLENPMILENETFTELLRAVFHLTEELHHRKELDACSQNDLIHLKGDIDRVFGQLIIQWLEYMKYLKVNYPYLFSLAARMNPFDENAVVMIE